MNRRQWLKGSMVLSLGLSHSAFASTSSLGFERQWLDLQRKGERFLVDIRSEAGWQQAAWLLRDESAQTIGVPDARLLTLLAWGQAQLNRLGEPPVMVISSALRTPRTNAAIEGAAERSLHLPNQDGVFQAVDLTGSPERLGLYYHLFDQVQGLGLGRYSTHLHVDTRGYDARWRG